MAKAKKAPPAPDETPKDGCPTEPQRSAWERLWDELRGIELHRSTADAPQTTLRASDEVTLIPVFEGKHPLGVLVEKTDRRGRKLPRKFLIASNNIKAYQFGDHYMELSMGDSLPEPSKSEVEDDAEVLVPSGVAGAKATPGRAAGRPPRRGVQKKMAAEMIDDDLEPDQGAIEELKRIEDEMRESQEEEAQYQAVMDDGDEILGEDDEE